MKLIWTACVGSLVALAGASYYWLEHYAYGSPLTPPDITAKHRLSAENLMGVRFPKSAQLVVYSPGNQRLEVKLVMPAVDLSKLLAQKPLKGAVLQSDDLALFDGEKGIPELSLRGVRKFRVGNVHFAEFTDLDVLIDDASDSVKTVYLSWCEY